MLPPCLDGTVHAIDSEVCPTLSIRIICRTISTLRVDARQPVLIFIARRTAVIAPDIIISQEPVFVNLVMPVPKPAKHRLTRLRREPSRNSDIRRSRLFDYTPTCQGPRRSSA
jgi:hypothetical protein